MHFKWTYDKAFVSQHRLQGLLTDDNLLKSLKDNDSEILFFFCCNANRKKLVIGRCTKGFSQGEVTYYANEINKCVLIVCKDPRGKSKH